MGPSGDYQDEMDDLSSRDVVERLRSELLVEPTPETAERHLYAMQAAVSRPGNQGGIVMRMKTRKRFASLGLAATLVLGAGIAAALTLPEQAADKADERTAGIEAPKGPEDQGENGSIQSETASEHGKAVSEAARDDSTQGCEQGRAVSDLASSKADDNRKNEGDHPGDCGPNGGNGAAASAAKADNGNHGQANNANQGQSTGGQASNSGGNGKNELPHGRDTAPGQASDETSELGDAPDDLLPPEA